jgi:hypothetical protein
LLSIDCPNAILVFYHSESRVWTSILAQVKNQSTKSQIKQKKKKSKAIMIRGLNNFQFLRSLLTLKLLSRATDLVAIYLVAIATEVDFRDLSRPLKQIT